MELLPALRILWRRRLQVIVGLVLAGALAFHLASKPRPHAGLATTRLMVDTSTSQLLTADPRGSETLGWRAALIAHLLGSEASRRQIATTLHIPENHLAIVDPVLATPENPTTLPTAAAKAAAILPEPYALTVRYDTLLPIISLEAHAPTPAAAAALATAGTKALDAMSSPTASKQVIAYRVAPVTPVSAREVAVGHGKLLAIVAFVVTFGFWCGCVMLASRIASGLGLRRRPVPAA